MKAATLVFLSLFAFALSIPSNITQIIVDNGYPCEQYYAQTSDGYLLSIQRIPYGKSNKDQKNKPVAFFQHGLIDNANGISLNPPQEALPFILADAGYDVFLGNNRGNGYSMKNVNFATNTKQFWNFSWDEMALIDLPTHIEYALKLTGRDTLTYIGHSEGTIQAFAGLVSNHEIAKKINLFVALAPVAYVGNIRATVLKVAAKLKLDEIFEFFGDGDFQLPEFVRKFLPWICTRDTLKCDQDILEAAMGPSVNTNISRIPYYLNFEPNPTSVKNLAHWAQGVSDNQFQKYDYGTAGNLRQYGQPTPPPYRLSDYPASTPLAIFSGGNDYLADPTDVARLKAQLPVQAIVYNNYSPTYSHTDFLWATNAREQIYEPIITLMEKYNK